MMEEDQLFDFMKELQPMPKCPRLRDETGSQPARLKVLSKGGSRPGQGQGPKVSKKARTPRKSQAEGQEKRAQDREPKRTKKKEERSHLLQAPKEKKNS